MTDKERIDWLESSFGFAVVNDDNGHWACVRDGVQNVPMGDDTEDIQTVFFIKKEDWKLSVRDAIDAAITEDDA
jgi:hypothetical protein